MREEFLVISDFNKRNSKALEEVYTLYHSELHFYAQKLFANYDIDPSDVVHDVFLKMWSNETIKFDELKRLKYYMYASVKNYLVNYLKHQQSVGKYGEHVLNLDRNSDCALFETELFSILEEAQHILPSDLCTVLRMIVEGYEMKEIAEAVNCSQSHIYAKRDKAVKLLRRKMGTKSFFLTFFLN